MKSKKPEFKTWDQMCLDKLREIGRSSLTKWALAMDYVNSTCMAKTAKILEREGKIRLIPNKGKIKNFYEVIKEVSKSGNEKV